MEKFLIQAQLLCHMGDFLFGIDEVKERNEVGFNQPDWISWPGVRGDATEMAHVLKKYLKTQLGQFGEEGREAVEQNYPQSFRVEVKVEIKLPTITPVLQVLDARWGAALLMSHEGSIPTLVRRRYIRVNQKFGLWWDRGLDRNYVPGRNIDSFDFAGYKAELEALGFTVNPVPVFEKTPEAELTLEKALSLLDQKRINNAFICRKVGDMFEFRFSFSTVLNGLFSNKTSQLSGIVECRVSDWARLTNNLDLALEAITKARELLPSWKFFFQGIEEAQVERDMKKAAAEAPIPELMAMINPEIVPFPFQNDFVRFLNVANGNALIGAEMGLGKTLISLCYAAMNNKRILVVCPKVVRRTWIQEAKKFFPGYFTRCIELTPKSLKKNGMPDLSQVQIASVNFASFEKFLPAIQAAGFDVMVIDECFGPETLIDTPSGPVRIDQIKVGDEVYSAAGTSTVLGTKRTQILDSRTELRYGGQTVTCSSHHPFLTSRGWVFAENLKEGDTLVSQEEAVQLLREEFPAKPVQKAAFLRNLLLCEMENEATCYSSKGLHEEDSFKNKQLANREGEAGFGYSHETEESHAFSSHAIQSLGDSETNRMEANSSGRERPRADETGEIVVVTPRSFVEMESRGVFGWEISGISNELQSGSCAGLGPAVRRSGRLVALVSERAGQEKRSEVKGIRVDGVTVHESGGYPGNEQGFYYDLKVSGHPSFSVNGALVHNSHSIKNPKAKITKSVHSVSSLFAHKILLSGTAIKNKKDELFTQVELIRPGFFESKTALKMATIGGTWHKIQEFYKTASKAQVLKDLPEKLTSIIELEVEGCRDIPEDGKIDFEDIARMKSDIAIDKAGATIEFIKEMLESSDSSMLVFSDSVEVAKQIHEAMGDLSLLHHGQLSDEVREAAKAEFQREGTDKRVFCTTRQSLAVGATLTRADKVIFNDLPWNTADEAQATARAHRIGQKNMVNVYWIKAAGNRWDSKVIGILKKKAELARKVLEGKKLTAEEQAWMEKGIGLDDLQKDWGTEKTNDQLKKHVGHVEGEVLDG
jgi:hypothetical protein